MLDVCLRRKKANKNVRNGQELDSDQSSLTLTRIVPVVDAVTLRFLAALPFLELLITSIVRG